MSQRILAQLVVFPGVRERAAREVVEGKKEVVVFGGGGEDTKKISLPFFFFQLVSLSRLRASKYERPRPALSWPHGPQVRVEQLARTFLYRENAPIRKRPGVSKHRRREKY